MPACRTCGKVVPDNWKFCPECGQDQSQAAPRIGDPEPPVPPEPGRIATPYNPVPPPPQQGPPAWLSGMGYTFGGCMLIAFVSLAAFLGFMILVASCMAVGSAGGA